MKRTLSDPTLIAKINEYGEKGIDCQNAFIEGIIWADEHPLKKGE